MVKLAYVFTGVVMFLLGSSLALSTPGINDAFVEKYPEIAETQLNSCSTCHMPAISGTLNQYGIDLKDVGFIFDEIADLDSDGDGVSNIEEITNLVFPGSQADTMELFVFSNFMGAVTFNHRGHSIGEKYLSQGSCVNCHGEDLFAQVFDDNTSVKDLAHQTCKGCHTDSGSANAPTACDGCHVR